MEEHDDGDDYLSFLVLFPSDIRASRQDDNQHVSLFLPLAFESFLLDV